MFCVLGGDERDAAKAEAFALAMAHIARHPEWGSKAASWAVGVGEMAADYVAEQFMAGEAWAARRDELVNDLPADDSAREQYLIAIEVGELVIDDGFVVFRE